MTRLLRLVPGLAAVLVVVGLGWAPAASAEPPLRLADQVTDTVGALSSDGALVRAALDDLRAQTGVQLFVVFVDSFDGVPVQQWADETATLSDLGSDDYLLAVAVGDRAYAYSVDPSAQISDDGLATVARDDIEPRLAAGDWSGAAIGAANGYSETLGSRDGAVGGEDGPAGGSSVLPWVLVAAGAGAASAFVVRRRRMGAATSSPAGPPVQPPVEIEKLHAQANRLLVETDDAVRASEQELGFAVAEFGTARTEAFEQALASSRAALARGFAVRQQLEDDVPETEDERRVLLTRVIEECDAANQVLDDEAERFDELRDLLTSAPQRLERALAGALP